MLRAGIVSSVVLFSSAGLAEAAPDETILVGPGTVMFWASTYGSSVDRYSETLLANGDGFELFKTDDDYGSGEPSDYYALFSGILYVGCDEAIWSSEHKFDSGTGWPSFYQPIRETAVDKKTDFKLIYPRTECHCGICGLHLGHVFKDGPPPTGERWCINGAMLRFKVAGV